MTVTMSIYSNTISTHKVIHCPRIITTNEVRQNAPMVTRLFFFLLFWGEGDGGQGIVYWGGGTFCLSGFA
jgi:hypothetical protein